MSICPFSFGYTFLYIFVNFDEMNLGDPRMNNTAKVDYFAPMIILYFFSSPFFILLLLLPFSVYSEFFGQSAGMRSLVLSFQFEKFCFHQEQSASPSGLSQMLWWMRLCKRDTNFLLLILIPKFMQITIKNITLVRHEKLVINLYQVLSPICGRKKKNFTF